MNVVAAFALAAGVAALIYAVPWAAVPVAIGFVWLWRRS